MWRRRTSPITSSGDRTLGDGRPAPPPRQGLSLQTAHLGTWRVAGPQRKENLALDIYINESLNLSYKVFINLKAFQFYFTLKAVKPHPHFVLCFQACFSANFMWGHRDPRRTHGARVPRAAGCGPHPLRGTTGLRGRSLCA